MPFFIVGFLYIVSFKALREIKVFYDSEGVYSTEKFFSLTCPFLSTGFFTGKAVLPTAKYKVYCMRLEWVSNLAH